MSQGFDPNQQEVEIAWYTQFMEDMLREGIKEEGHLSETMDLVLELNYLHQGLLTHLNDKMYKEQYTLCMGDINDLKKRYKGKNKSELTVFLEAIYMIWVLKQGKKSVSPDTLSSMERIIKLMAILAKKYQVVMQGAN